MRQSECWDGTVWAWHPVAWEFKDAVNDIGSFLGSVMAASYLGWWAVWLLGGLCCACLVQTTALAITLGPIRISALLDKGQHHSGCWDIQTRRCQTLNTCTGAYDHPSRLHSLGAQVCMRAKMRWSWWPCLAVIHLLSQALSTDLLHSKHLLSFATRHLFFPPAIYPK